MSDTLTQSRQAINHFYRIDEESIVTRLLEQYPLHGDRDSLVRMRAAGWITELRKHPGDRTLLEDFMQRYSLSTAEGVALMSIAEAFLRVPDTEMGDRLIIDKITHADWDHASVEGEKLLTTFSGWGLRVSETLLSQESGIIGTLAQRVGLPVIRQAVSQAIKLLGGQFVSGRTIEEAIKRATKHAQEKTTFSYDMLGEGARTEETAAAYFASYKHALETIGHERAVKDLYQGDGVSIKLSALHPRYEELQQDQCFEILVSRVLELARIAKHYDVMVTLDAEEADRLELSLDIFEAVFSSPDLDGYNGLGLAVQAYQKRAVSVIEYLIALARSKGKTIPVRLVKGAYWDTEIKRGQERGLSGYPVFTRKISTDISYLVAADKMLAAKDALYPAFATHNAYTISAILELAKTHENAHYEFQRLHGMGEQLYKTSSADDAIVMPLCRVYSPVGVHRDLLPYLVRRLLENGANSSFVHQLYEKNIPVEKLVENPAERVLMYAQKAHSEIPLPSHIYNDRLNSVAPDLSDRTDRKVLMDAIGKYKLGNDPLPKLEEADIKPMMQNAAQAFIAWNKRHAKDRADILDKIASLYEMHRDELLALCVNEGKKTVPDAIAEWREAIDFCRYYAQQAREKLAMPEIMQSITGEDNRLLHEGRGVFVCVSPWNFPLAIFTGQVVAALVTGNTVLAKPAEQTPRIAQRAVELMHKAGVPQDVLQLVIGSGRVIGSACIANPLCAGVAFTGSTETAWTIQKTLADRKAPIAPLIAETGGQNAMIVDSTALPEQVVDDVIRSAFHSAGQRCSALRVLYLQEDIAEDVMEMLKGAMRTLIVGDPARLSTDVGPVIDEKACNDLLGHAAALRDHLISQTNAPRSAGDFVLPTVFKIDAISDLDKENFGPLLHIVTYKSNEIPNIVAAINQTGYGLTLGIHSRVESQIEYIVENARVGNIYVNRGMTGAVVGQQPFGGMGLSGTGPKAGGPNYLSRFVTEKTVSTNVTAAGGNTKLATLPDMTDI